MYIREVREVGSINFEHVAFAACCISAVFLLAVKEILVVHKNRQRPVTFESVGDENKNI